jgi:thiol-disulfide isomerase/thioredoxin
MSTSTRWTLLVLAVVAVVIAAYATQLGDRRHEGPAGSGRPVGGGSAGNRFDDPADLAGPRRRADLPPCPSTAEGPGPTALRRVMVQCAADGAEIDTARALAGRQVVLNLWAYWCGPCTQELPAMAEYQNRAGSAVTVVTVHQDPNAAAGLMRLAELGVRLPTLQDGDRRIAAALHVPNVMPATVVLRTDGTVADILPRAFASADEIEGAVADALL